MNLEYAHWPHMGKMVRVGMSENGLVTVKLGGKIIEQVFESPHSVYVRYIAKYPVVGPMQPLTTRDVKKEDDEL